MPQNAFAPLADRAGSVWLDSSMHFGDRGRRSFIVADPQLDVMLTGDRVLVTAPDRRLEETSGDRIWEILSRLWNEQRYFSVGYISYEATLPFLGLTSRHQETSIPAVRFLFYDTVQSFEHPDDLESDQFGVDDSSRDGVWPERGSPAVRVVDADYRQTLTREKYYRRILTIKNHIREGDIYQANFTTRIDVPGEEPPFEVYCRLHRQNPAPYSAFMNFGDYQLLSASPERMFTLRDRQICTGPIKGTIAGGGDPRETERNRRRLMQSDKDRAELLMIVDLERNDLGRIARPGSVSVEHLFKTETYASVIHLVSDISAELAAEVSLTDVLAAMLPGGSITGAPKRRAVEIIDQLETVPRSIYTGCIGYVHGNEADFSIAIRTMTHADSVYRIHAGGGIVADSEPQAEYEEMLLKASGMLRAVGVTRERSLC